MLTLCYRMLIEASGMTCELDDPTQEKIIKVVEWLRQGRKPGLMLAGTVGNGKTTMATAVCILVRMQHRSSLESECRGIWHTTAPDLVERKLKDEAAFERYKRTEMLCIDDLGVESANLKSYGTDMTPISDLLYYRYQHRLFTLVTTNLDTKGFEQRYGPRLSDRRKEMFDCLAYTDLSYRK